MKKNAFVIIDLPICILRWSFNFSKKRGFRKLVFITIIKVCTNFICECDNVIPWHLIHIIT